MWQHGVGVVTGQSVFRGAGDARGSGSVACAACDDRGCVRGGLCDGVMVAVMIVCIMR